MTWQSLLITLRENRRNRRLTQAGRSERLQSCPHDGQPYEVDSDGRRRCPFDGYSPDGHVEKVYDDE